MTYLFFKKNKIIFIVLAILPLLLFLFSFGKKKQEGVFIDDSYINKSLETFSFNKISSSYSFLRKEEVALSFSSSDNTIVSVYGDNASYFKYIPVATKSPILWHASILSDGSGIMKGMSSSEVFDILNINPAQDSDHVVVTNLEGGLEFHFTFEADVLKDIEFRNTYIH